MNSLVVPRVMQYYMQTLRLLEVILVVIILCRLGSGPLIHALFFALQAFLDAEFTATLHHVLRWQKAAQILHARVHLRKTGIPI